MANRTFLPLLLWGVTTISVAQSAVFGVALPLIVGYFKVSYYLMGLFMAIWSIITAVFFLGLNRYIDRANPSTWLIVSLLLSSAATTLNTYTNNVVMLNVVRIIVSVSSSLVWPFCGKITAMYMGDRTGYASSIFNAGSLSGFALSYLIVWLTGNNWEAAMLASGLMGLAYTLPVTLMLRRLGPVKAGSVEHGAEARIRALGINVGLVDRMAILLMLGQFTALYSWSTLISWLSTFLVAELKMSYGSVTAYMLAVAVASGILEVTVGSLSDRLGGLRVRAMVLRAGLWISAALLLPTTLAVSPLATASLISASLLSWRISSISFWSIVNDISPMEYYGRVSFIYMIAPPLSSITASMVGGYLASALGSLRLDMLISAALGAVSPLFYSAAIGVGRRLGRP